MLTLYVEASELKRWCGVYRKSITKEGYQRTLKKDHFGGIRNFLDADETRNVIPNSLVIAFNDALEIGGATEPGATLAPETSFHPVASSSGVVDSETEVTQGTLTVRVHPACISADLTKDDTTIEEELSDHRSAYVIDGQHRIAGGNAASTKVYYPVTAFLGITKEDQAFHYIVINKKAKKVSKHDIDAVIPKEIYEDLQGRLAAAAIYGSAADVVWALDNDADSPFQSLIKWANNEDDEAPFGKGGIDNVIKALADFPKDVFEKFDESEPLLLKAAWRGIRRAFEPLWTCGSKYAREPGTTFPNQLHIKSAAVLPALQRAFNTAVSSSSISTKGDISAEELADRTYEYFKNVPLEFFYCEWQQKSITNDDSIKILANHIATACRTGEVPYIHDDWFKACESYEEKDAAEKVKKSQRKAAKKKLRAKGAKRGRRKK